MITIHHSCVSKIPVQQHPVIVATGPLTDSALAEDLQKILGETSLSFYDAIAPIGYGFHFVSAKIGVIDIPFRCLNLYESSCVIDIIDLFS